MPLWAILALSIGGIYLLTRNSYPAVGTAVYLTTTWNNLSAGTAGTVTAPGMVDWGGGAVATPANVFTTNYQAV